MREMLHEYTHEFLYFEENLYLLIQMLILLLVREYTAFPKVSEMMKEYEKYKSMVEIGISYMHEHYAEPLTLKQVSQVSMMSVSYTHLDVYKRQTVITIPHPGVDGT